MKKSLLFTLILTITSISFAQTIEWGKQGEVEPINGVKQPINGVYYALYDDGRERTVELNKEIPYTYSVPGNVLTFEAKKYYKNSLVQGWGDLQISDGFITTPWKFACSASYKFGSEVVNKDSRSIVFSNPSPNGYNKYIRNVRLTMASYLNAPSVDKLTFADAEVDSPAEQQAFTFDWCNTGTVTVSYEGDPAFIVSTGEKDTNGKYGAATVYVTCTHSSAGTHQGKVIISNGTAESTHTVTLTGTTRKLLTTFEWKSNLTPMQVGTVCTDAATASSGGQITYISSDPSVIRVEGNRLIAVSAGTATITASVAENDRWGKAEDSKTITVTALQAQYIQWSQSFLRLNTETEDILLQAQSYATETDTPTGLPVVYTSSDPSVVEVRTQTGADGNTLYWLHVVAAGTATLTASCDGNGQFAAAVPYPMTVVVRMPSEGCNPLVYEQTSSTDLTTGLIDFSGTYGPEIELNGEPGYLSFDAKKSRTSAKGKLSVQKKLNGTWQEIGEFDLSTDYQTFDGIWLERNVTHIQFYKKTGATLTHTYTNVSVTLAKYLEPEQSSLAFETAVGATVKQELTVHYSNIPDVLFVDVVGQDADAFKVEPAEIGNDCGDHGTATLTVSYHPAAAGSHEAVLRIADRKGTMSQTVKLTGNAFVPVRKWLMLSPGQDGSGDYTYTPSDTLYQRLVYAIDGNNYANLHIPSGTLSFAQEENVLLTIEADRWRTLVPPFDVESAYIVELVPESRLATLSRTEAMAVQRTANHELYAWLAEQTALANRTAADTETLLSLIETYLARLRTDKGYAADAVGVWALEQYNGKNSWTANYYAYAAGDGQWNLSEDTPSGFVKEWEIESLPSCLLRKGQVYALRFPYCVECDPASSDVYDYWSGKCLLLHGAGGQSVDGADAADAVLAMQPAYGQALLTGNGTLAALPLAAGKAYVHQTDPARPYYDCYVLQESAADLPPLSSVLFAEAADAAGRTLRAVSRKGKAWYDAPAVTTGIPVLADAASVVLTVLPDGLLLQTKADTPVALYTVSGVLLWQGTIDAEGRFVRLSRSGIYVLHTPARTDKIFFP